MTNENQGGEVAKIAREAIEFISDLDNAFTEDRVVAGAAKKVSVRLRSRLQAALSPSEQPEPVAWRYKDAWGKWAYCQALDNINGPTVITEKQPLYAQPSEQTELDATISRIKNLASEQSGGGGVDPVIADAMARSIVAFNVPRLISASRALLEACWAADAEEELPEHIDGSLMDEVNDALAAHSGGKA